MIPARIRYVPLLLVIALGSGGCVYITSYRYFRLPEQSTAPGRFHFEHDGIRFSGALEESRTLIWLPGKMVLIPGQNPFHLRLFRDSEHPTVQIRSVSLEDEERDVLLTVNEEEDFHKAETLRRARWVPVFSANQEWDGPYRRISSRAGWRNSRPVSISLSRKAVILKVTFAKGDDSREGVLIEDEVTVPLRRYRFSKCDWVTDSVWGATGSMRPRPADKAQGDNR